jgi:two-component system, chemotaxis family, sensor kinase CheA
MDEIMGSFIEEVRELLLQLEDDLIEIEKSPGNGEIINNIFRVMHTLKGTAGMVGFKNIQDLTHEFEGLYVLVKEGKLGINSEIIDLTLQAKDLILAMLNSNYDDNSDSEIIRSLRKMTGKSHTESNPAPAERNQVPQTSGYAYAILFSPDKDVFERGLDPDKIIQEVTDAGETYILLDEKKKSWNQQKAEKTCQVTWEIYLVSKLNLSEIQDIFLFYDPEEFRVFEISDRHGSIDPDLAKRLAKIYKNKVTPEKHLKECLSLIPELQKDPVPAEPEKEDNTAKDAPSADAARSDVESTVNVSSHKLDELMNLVSELVTITATLEVHASGFNDPKLNISIENIEKLTKQFRNNALDLRLVPVGTLLTKFKRQIRDLSKDLNKRVNLLIEGQDIEIDKSILKSIESPLQHIIRNSIDHGFEPEEERIAKGKSPEGLLKITAFYSGASVIIQVQDDGRGINLERVKECALKRGMIQADQSVTKQELINMIMEPGFTTSENISIVSGRGVGMDVVKKELSVVGGSLEVFTETDLGTSIIMKLPTTLTIIDTLLVDVADTQILIPVMDIEYCYKDSTTNLFRKDNKYVQFKNNPIPLISLREEFKYQPTEGDETMVIVINKFERKYAITADRIVGEHQAVIKPLGDLFMNQPLFSGGSIMVDGKLALILDTNFLFNHITEN